MRSSYAYAIARFCPYLETGEFANFAVLLIDPAGTYVGFRALGRWGRVSDFFGKEAGAMYRSATALLRKDVEVLRQLVVGTAPRVPEGELRSRFVRNVTNEFVRPRESIVQFGQLRAILSDRSADQVLKELYQFHIERSFATAEYHQVAMERSVRSIIDQANVGHAFRAAELGDDTFNVKLPFVSTRAEQPNSAIKPLDLALSEPTKILEKGGNWLFKMDQLKRRDALPKKLLFVVEAPDDGAKKTEAYEEVVEGLQGRGAEVLSISDSDGIARFAKRATGPQLPWTPAPLI